jgi:hypothetical protein
MRYSMALHDVRNFNDRKCVWIFFLETECILCQSLYKIAQMDVELLRYTDFNYVASRLKTNRWANMETQFNFLSG